MFTPVLFIHKYFLNAFTKAMECTAIIPLTSSVIGYHLFQCGYHVLKSSHHDIMCFSLVIMNVTMYLSPVQSGYHVFQCSYHLFQSGYCVFKSRDHALVCTVSLSCYVFQSIYMYHAFQSGNDVFQSGSHEWQ